jgi:spore maturation protein CgeB
VGAVENSCTLALSEIRVRAVGRKLSVPREPSGDIRVELRAIFFGRERALILRWRKLRPVVGNSCPRRPGVITGNVFSTRPLQRSRRSRYYSVARDSGGGAAEVVVFTFMKFVIFGLTISSSWGNGHATLWRALCRALAARGHRVVFFEEDRPYYAAHRDLGEIPGGALRLYSSWADARSVAQRELAEADVAIVTSYCADAIAATELMLEAPALRVFYDLDTPVTLEALGSGQTVNYLGPRGLIDYELVLSYTGGRALDQLRDRLGASCVAPLYGSVDPDVHHPIAPEARFACDLSYLGTYAADRQDALKALLIAPARKRPAQRFLIGGAQYPAEFPWTPNIFFVQHIEPAQHPAFFASCRLTLNITRRAMKAMGWCPSGRLFEAAACGAPLLTDTWAGLEEFFTAGTEILIARSPDEATAALDLSDAELRRIADAARERVLAEHTARHRAMELETLVAEASSRPVAEAALHTGS